MMQTHLDHSPANADPMALPARRRPPRWARPLFIVMGAATPGGLLLIIALLSESHIDFEPSFWLFLDALGGVGGYLLHRRLLE